VLALALAALAPAGCGLALGPAPSAVQLLVTSEFGAHLLHRSGVLHAHEGETVLDLLSRSLPVRTGAHGDAVASIDGLAGGSERARTGQVSTWSYYVNGVRVAVAPARRGVHPGDHVWWDLHDSADEPATPAVVGSFPEPFLNGIEGKRLPVRVECASDSGSACSTVTNSLQRLGVPAAVAAIGSGGAPETLRVMVGPWVYLEDDLEAQSIGHGPRASGVYALPALYGHRLTLLDPEGRAVRTLRGEAGLIAATTGPKEAPVWVITGTDVAGVQLAARSLKQTTLAGHFAVAVAPGAVIPLPVSAPPAPGRSPAL